MGPWVLWHKTLNIQAEIGGGELGSAFDLVSLPLGFRV